MGCKNLTPMFNIPETFGKALSYEGQIHVLRDAIVSLNNSFVSQMNKTFNVVHDMQICDDLQVGMICHTNGFYSSGDGGAAFYTISDTGTPNGMDVIQCGNLYANLVIDETYNPCQFGADSTGTMYSSDAINAFIEKNKNSTVNFFTGTYKLDSPIITDYEYTTSINFNGSKLITDDTCDCALAIGYKNAVTTHAGGAGGVQDHYPRRCAYFNNFYIESHGNYAIRIKTWYMNARFNDFTCFCYKNGIQDGDYIGHPSDALFDNFFICNNDMSLNYTGFEIYATDSKYINGRIYAFKVGITAYPSITLQNVHFLATNVSHVTNFNNDYIAILFKRNTADSLMTNIYCDSYNTFIKVEGNHYIICSVQGFKMNQWKQMNSGNGIMFDLNDITGQAVKLIVHDAIVNNNSGMYNKFKFVKIPFSQIKKICNTCEFTGIVIDSNENDKFDLYEFVYGCMNKQVIPRTFVSQTDASVWYYIGRIATSDAWSSVTVKTRDINNGVTGTFRVNFNVEGAPSSIIRWDQNGGKPRIGINTVEGGYDLYYTETQGTYYTQIQVEFISNFYILNPCNNRIFVIDPVTTSTEPDITSPLSA